MTGRPAPRQAASRRRPCASIAGLLRRPQDGSSKARWTSMGSRMAWSLSMEWPRLALQPLRPGGGDLRAAQDDDTDADDGLQAPGDQGARQAHPPGNDTQDHTQTRKRG